MTDARRAAVRLYRVDNFAIEICGMYERITNKADEYYAARGFIYGHEVDDWLLAVQNVITRPSIELRRENQHFLVEMPMPDGDVPDLEIRVTSNQLLATSGPNSNGRHIFRLVRFPEPIDRASADADIVADRLRIAVAIAGQSPNCSPGSED